MDTLATENGTRIRTPTSRPEIQGSSRPIIRVTRHLTAPMSKDSRVRYLRSPFRHLNATVSGTIRARGAGMKPHEPLSDPAPPAKNGRIVDVVGAVLMLAGSAALAGELLASGHLTIMGGLGFLSAWMGWVACLRRQSVVVAIGGGFLAACGAILLGLLLKQGDAPTAAYVPRILLVGLCAATAIWWVVSARSGRHRLQIVEAAVRDAERRLAERTAPELVISVDRLLWYGAVDADAKACAIWIICKGRDAQRIPPWFGFERLGPKEEPDIPKAVLAWMRELEGEVISALERRGWRWQRPGIGFESEWRIHADPRYFQ
jgi:hypothetical protein